MVNRVTAWRASLDGWRGTRFVGAAPTMRLILIGPPGSGKGTQAKLLAQRLDLTHIATGDILREAIARDLPVGQEAQPFIKAGQLVPDVLVNKLIAERLLRPDHPHRFVLDGYPRTVAQARALDAVLAQQKLDLSAAIFLEVPDEELVSRISGRWICPKCQAPYHLVNQPPRQPGFCDSDPDTALVQRADDREQTVRSRLRAYRAWTAELVPIYRERGQLRSVPGQGDVETIFHAIEQALA